MSHAFALRSSSSGPQFDGNADDVLTMQADGKCKFLPPSAGGGVLPLTLQFWVDGGRIGTTQDGSIANPFLTIQGGIDAIEASLAGAGSLIVAQGNYNNEELHCALDIAIVASTAPITVAKLGTEDGPVPGIRLYNVNVTGEAWLIGGLRATTIEGGGLRGDVHLTGETQLVGINAEFGDITCPDSLSTITLRGCHALSVNPGDTPGLRADSLTCFDTTIDGSAEAENAFLHMSTVNGGLTANRATLDQSTVNDGLTVANTLTADTFSLTAARNGSISANPLPLLTNVTDHRSTFGILAVPAIEQGSFADVTIGAPGLGAREGDGVIVMMADPQLANVGIANAWITAAGACVVRFFGTTAGGNQTFNLSLIPIAP